MAWTNPFSRNNGGSQFPQGNQRGGQQEQSQRAPVQQASQQQQNQQPQNTQFQTPTGGPGMVTNPNQGPGQSQQMQSPLDAIGSVIWGQPQTNQQQSPNAGMQQMQQQQQMPQQPQQPQYDGYTVPWDNARMTQVMQGTDFMRGISPELMTRLQGGDWSALGEMLNHVGRQATQLSMQAAHGFVDRGVKTGLDRFGSSLDDRFRDYNIRSQTPDDELVAHPANAPIFEMLKNQVAQTNPHFNPAQVKDAAMQWFKAMGESFTQRNTQQQQQQNTDPSATKNWAAEFGLEDQNGNPAAGFPGSQTFPQQQMPQQQNFQSAGGAPSGGTFNNGF